MIVRARSPIALGRHGGASHAGYRRRTLGMGITLNCVADPESCRNPTPAILSLDQTSAAASSLQYAPPVYTCPTCAGMSTDPSVFQSAAYITQLNALGATSAVNDENARRFANYQNAVANALYSSSAPPSPPVYMTLADYYAANPSLQQPTSLFSTAPAGSTIPISGGEYQGGFIPPGGTTAAPAPAPAPSAPASTPTATVTKPATVIPFVQGNTPGSFGGPATTSTPAVPVGQSNAPAPVTVGGGAAQSNAPGATFQTVLGIPVSSSWLSGSVFGIPTWIVLAGGVGIGALLLFQRK